MGSCNSENSASMNSKELSELIGHKYANANIPHQHDSFALHFDLEIEHSLYTEDVAYNEPLSPRTLTRVREMHALILNNGSEK